MDRLVYLCDGFTLFSEGDYALAERQLQDVIKIGQGKELEKVKISAEYWLGKMAIYRGDIEASRPFLREAVRKKLYGTFFNWDLNSYFIWDLNSYIDGIENLAATRQEWKTAAILLGASESWYHQHRHMLLKIEHQFRISDTLRARQALGEEGFEHYWEEGKKLSFKQALTYGLAYLEAERAN